MPLPSASVAVALLITAYLGYHVIACLRSPLNAIPGPLYARFTHLPLKLATLSGQRMHHVHALHARYGSHVRISPTEIAVNDPVSARQIHAVNSGFRKTQWYEDLVGQERLGLFSMRNEGQHSARRRLFSRAFSKSYLRGFWEPLVREKVSRVVERMKEEGKKGRVDVLRWWTAMATDVVTNLSFGEDFGQSESGETSEYMRTVQMALMGGAIGAELPIVRLIGRLLPFELTKRLFVPNELINRYSRRAVDNMRVAGTEKNIFTKVMQESEKGETTDELDVMTEAGGLIVAGSDTTAITLTYLVYAVLSQPDLQRQLEDEVGQLPVGYNDADVEQLELLNASIQEALRLYGAAPGGLPRSVPAGGRTLGGYYIPAGTVVTTQSHTSHRDSDVFVHPERFMPDRWLKSSQAMPEDAKTAYAPFGAGSRTCLGVHLAQMEMRMAAAEFFRSCRGCILDTSTTSESMEQENFFLAAPKAHKCYVILTNT